MNNKMRPSEVISGKTGDLYVKVKDTRYHCFHFKEIEHNLEYHKGVVAMLGRQMDGHKINGMEGKYKGKGYYRFSELRKLAEDYKNGGPAPIYEMEVINEDPSTSAGVQRILLKDCMPDSDILAKLNVDEDFLEEDLEGTFDDFEILEMFNGDMDGRIE